MSHNHSYCCDHENVKYCKICRVTYCVDCKQEWGHGNYWTLSTPYLGGCFGTGQFTNRNTDPVAGSSTCTGHGSY